MYLALQTLQNKDWVLQISLQACFASIARLKAFRSQNPIPHFFLWVHNLFQWIQCTVLSSWFRPHQYLANKKLILSQIDFGSLNNLIEYVGIACATILIRISRPALEINFSFHPITCLVIFSWSSLKVFILDLPQVISKPRYFSQSVITLAPSIYWMAFPTFGLVFSLKKSDVFCLLMAWLEAALCFPKRLSNLQHSSIVAR